MTSLRNSSSTRALSSSAESRTSDSGWSRWPPPGPSGSPGAPVPSVRCASSTSSTCFLMSLTEFRIDPTILKASLRLKAADSSKSSVAYTFSMMWPACSSWRPGHTSTRTSLLTTSVSSLSTDSSKTEDGTNLFLLRIRLKTPSSCFNTDSETSDLFFIPPYTSMKIARAMLTRIIYMTMTNKENHTMAVTGCSLPNSLKFMLPNSISMEASKAMSNREK
mmetsp:Transcript_130881/g.406976  ORF Transcript_130881/g.406976 Transcript_130881/m.406976 type:complete len:220 (-) Transcript_130881:907-1566(-)